MVKVSNNDLAVFFKMCYYVYNFTSIRLIIMEWAFGRFHINLWLKRGRVEVRNPQSQARSPSLAAGGTPIYTRDLHVLCSVQLCCRAGSNTEFDTML